MTEQLSDLARKVADGDAPVSVLDVNPGSLVSPESAVRRLHAELPDLGLTSPFGEVAERLTRVDRMRVEATHLDNEAFRRRREIAGRLASGDLELSAAVAALDVTTTDIEPGVPGIAVQLADEARQSARTALAGELASRAGQLFDQLAEAVAATVASLEALPEPPRNLWVGPDPTVLLARAKGHEQTLSIVAGATSRFWRLQHLVSLVREQAGFGAERLTSGAPRDALVYKNWHATIDGDRELRQTRASMQLWRTVVDDWQPGVWRPDQIDVPVEDRSFGARLRNLGRAVG